MLIKKLTALALSAIMTCGVVAASAAGVPETKTNSELLKMVSDCRLAYFSFRYAKDGGKMLENTVKRYSTEKQGALLVVCLAYGEGYEDGRRGIT